MSQHVAAELFLGLLAGLLLLAAWDMVRERSGSRFAWLLLVLGLLCAFGALSVHFFNH